jgi:hypothetical protein
MRRYSPLAFDHPPAGDHFCVAKVLLQKENTILTDGVESVKKACHCEPVRTLARQSVSKTNKFCAFRRFLSEKIRIPTPVTSVTGSE